MEEKVNLKMELMHAFGSTCSLDYSQAIAIASEGTEQPRVIFPAGKTMISKSIERNQMNFIHFDNSVELVECIHVLPTRTHVATSQKPYGSNLRVVRIYSIQGNQPPQTIKIFSDRQNFGTIRSLIFSASEPKFMCCLIGQPYHKLIYVDISKHKTLAESHFTIKDVEKISISPKNSHLICASGGNSLKIFKVEEYAFKPLEEIRKLPKGRKYLGHAWYRNRIILTVTDRCEVLIIEEGKPNVYEVKQEYTNVFNEPNQDKINITAICTFSKGFILGSSNGKFCLWVRKEETMSYQEEKLELVRKWSTTDERISKVTGITVSGKEDLLAVSLLNNDIATIFLNDLLPQVKDLEKEKTNKEIVFQYVYKGFHNNNITGMDLCMQRPLLATCSHDDSTIRIWNYKNFECKLLRMFYFRVKEIGEKPLITLAFHPFGYFLGVGCVDKVRFFYVLSNQLRPYREINIKRAHILQFSHGGHSLAIAAPPKQDFSDQNIYIYNAITLEEIVVFSVHSSTIRTLQWKRHDEYLCSISQDGVLVEWRVNDWVKTKSIHSKDLKYECLTYFYQSNSIIAFAYQNGKKFLHQYACDGSGFDEVQIDMKVVTMAQISTSKKSAILMGLENGSMVIFSIDNYKVMDIRSEHLRRINDIRVSPCNRYVMTSGNDCMIFIYKVGIENNGAIQEEESASSTVDDFLADVVLFPKRQIQKYNDKEKELSKVLENLERKLKYITQEGEKKHKQKVQDLQLQKRRVIDDLQYRIDRVNEQINMVKVKNQETLEDLDSKNFYQASELEKKYEEKINFEKEKYFQLQQEIIQQKMIHQEKLQELRKWEKQQIQNIKQSFQNKFYESEKIYTHSKASVEQAIGLFDERIKQIEGQQEEQLKQLQDRLQSFRIEKARAEEEHHQKLNKIKKEHKDLTEERDDNKRKNQQLIITKKKIEKEVEEAKEKLRDMRAQYDQKIETLKNKETKIISFEKKIDDLQKKKHILSYKATEMKKALEPKQIQIEKLKIDLMKLKKQFDSSLHRKKNLVLYIDKIEKERQYLEKEVAMISEEASKKQNHLDQLIYEIYTCVQLNKNTTDGKVYMREIIKLYHKYVEKNQKYLMNNDQKGVQEMTKQIVHLQKSLHQMNQSNDKNLFRKNDQIHKRIKENAELVNNLNQIKQENQQTLRKIKSKNQQIQKLRQIKGQMLAELKKFNEPLYQLSQDDNFMMNQSRSILDKNQKLPFLDPTAKDGAIQIKTIKKRQCELVSQLEFINQKIHKAKFFVKQIKDRIKKHFTFYKCAGFHINIENDISQIK